MYNISDNTEIPKSTTCLQQQSVSLLQLAESFSSYRRSGCIVHKLMTMPISTVVSQLRSALSNYTAYGYEQCRSAYASSVRKIRNILKRRWKSHSSCYKKDGYRQQNVRKQQKLISIIDYDVCMTFY